MSKITWGVNDHGECAIFCQDCKHVFKRGLKRYEARETVEKKKITHNCNQGEKHDP